MSEIWTPHLTVAAIIEDEGRFLMVEEAPDGEPVYNQPAGHVEDGEPIIDAAVREVLEETARPFEPQALAGIYRWRSPRNDVTYLRVAVIGSCGEPEPGRELDPDIIATHWFDIETLRARQAHLRSPLVLRCFEDYLSGKRLPLDLVQELD